MIACKGMAADFLEWYEDTPHQDSISVIWNRAVDKAAEQTQPIAVFFTYRQTMCRILNLFSLPLAQTMAQVVSENDLDFYWQLDFLKATPWSYESFQEDFHIEKVFG